MTDDDKRQAVLDAYNDSPPVDDGFTDAERDFFSSRGENTEGLVSSDAVSSPPASEAPAAGATPAPAAVSPAPGAAPAAAPAAAPPEDGADDDDDAPAADGKPQRRVNFRKFQRSEEARKKAETEFAAFREQTAGERARLTERLDLINQALQTSPQQQAQDEHADPEPDPEQDIFAHNRWLGRQLAKANDRLSTYDERETARTQDTELQSNYQRDARRFAEQNPDFAQAYVHLIRNRLAELEAYGVTDPGERDRMVLAEERDLVARALRDGASPAERIFNLAKGRGYTRQAAPAPNGNGNPAAVPAAPAAAAAVPGSLAAPAAAPAAKPSVVEEVERIKKGQDASMSLSNAGGSPGDQLTPETLANMPMDQFQELLSRLPKSRQKELLGQ